MNYFLLGKKRLHSGSTVYEENTGNDARAHFDLSNSVWLDDSGHIDEESIALKSSENEVEMLCEASQFRGNLNTIVDPSQEKNVLFFSAPSVGELKIVKDREGLGAAVVFHPHSDHGAVNIGYGTYKGKITVFNSIVIKLIQPEFNDDLQKVIVVKILSDYIKWYLSSNPPTRRGRVMREDGIKYTRQDEAGQESTQHVFSRAKIWEYVQLHQSGAELNLWNECSNVYDNNSLSQIGTGVIDLSLPMHEGNIVPLYSFLRQEHLAYLKIGLGLANIDGQNWTWFEPKKILENISNEANHPTTARQVDKVYGFGAGDSQDSDSSKLRISQLDSLYMKIFNPHQLVYESTSEREDRAQDRRGEKSISYFSAVEREEVRITANNNSHWQQRKVRLNRHHRVRRSSDNNYPGFETIGAEPSQTAEYEIESTRRLLQIKAIKEPSSSGEKTHVVTSTHRLSESADSLISGFRQFLPTVGSTENTFANASEIDHWIREKTGSASYIDWFNDSVKNTEWNGSDQFSSRPVFPDSARPNFEYLWNNLRYAFAESPQEDGPARVNIIQVMCLMALCINEGPSMTPGRGEGGRNDYLMQALNRSNNGRKVMKKTSYNVPQNGIGNFSNIPIGALLFSQNQLEENNIQLTYLRDLSGVRGRSSKTALYSSFTRYNNHSTVFRARNGTLVLEGLRSEERRNLLMGLFGSVYPRKKGSIYDNFIEFYPLVSSIISRFGVRRRKISTQLLYEKVEEYDNANGTSIRRKLDEYFDRSTYLDTDYLSEYFANADFNKFKGRGYIQITTRANYRRLCESVINHSSDYGYGQNPEITRVIDSWHQVSGRYSVHGNELIDLILTYSTSLDWDALFNDETLIFPLRALYVYQKRKNNFLTQLSTDRISTETFLVREAVPGSIYLTGTGMSASHDYHELFYDRICQKIKALILSSSNGA